MGNNGSIITHYRPPQLGDDSSTQLKGMYADMASMIRIPSRKRFSWEEMANELEEKKTSLTQFVELLIPKEAKPQEALEAEKPNEASEAAKPKETSSQKQKRSSPVASVPARIAPANGQTDQRPRPHLLH